MNIVDAVRTLNEFGHDDLFWEACGGPSAVGAIERSTGKRLAWEDVKVLTKFEAVAIAEKLMWAAMNISPPPMLGKTWRKKLPKRPGLWWRTWRLPDGTWRRPVGIEFTRFDLFWAVLDSCPDDWWLGPTPRSAVAPERS